MIRRNFGRLDNLLNNAGIASMNMPISRNDPATIKPVLVGPTPKGSRNCTTAKGILKYANNQPKADAVPMQNNDMAANFAELNRIDGML